MTNEQVYKIRDRVAVIANAIIVLLVAFNVIKWDAQQAALVVAAVASLVLLVGALYAHFQPGTAKEWVAVGFALTALVGSGIAALNAIGVTDLSRTQVETIIGVFVAVFGLSAGSVTRERVTPYPIVPAPEVPVNAPPKSQ